MKTFRFILVFLCVLSSLNLHAGNEFNPIGARAYGLAGNSILFQDFWSTENNPAGLGFLEQWGAGFSYENQFLESEFANKALAFAHPFKAAAFGLSFTQFGFSNFQENKVGLSYGRALGENIAMGVQLNYLSTSIGEGYGSRSSFSGTIGLQAKINRKISIAAVIINPNRAERAEFDDERYPSLIKLGMAYVFSKKVDAYTEVVKDIDFDANLKVGLEYQAMEKIVFRAAYATNPALTAFGFGVKLKQFQLDVASGFDSNLGFSPQLSIAYRPR